MPQGKLKVKAKVPAASKKKSKGSSGSKRKNKPVAAKTSKLTKVQKVNKQITKNVNAALEKEIKEVANEGQKVFLSKKKTTKAAASKKK